MRSRTVISDAGNLSLDQVNTSDEFRNAVTDCKTALNRQHNLYADVSRETAFSPEDSSRKGVAVDSHSPLIHFSGAPQVPRTTWRPKSMTLEYNAPCTEEVLRYRRCCYPSCASTVIGKGARSCGLIRNAIADQTQAKKSWWVTNIELMD